MTTASGIWSPAQLKRINDDPALVSLLYDLNLLPEVVLAHIRHAREEERERIMKVLEGCHKGCNPDGGCAVCMAVERLSQERPKA